MTVAYHHRHASDLKSNIRSDKCIDFQHFGTCDSHTDFKVKRSKVKVTGRGHIVAAT